MITCYYDEDDKEIFIEQEEEDHHSIVRVPLSDMSKLLKLYNTIQKTDESEVLAK